MTRSSAAPRPEWADLGRLARRALSGVAKTARAAELPSLSGLLVDHLGPRVGTFPVLAEHWPSYEHVNVQTGLDHYLAAAGRAHRLLGVTGFRSRWFTLADVVHGAGDAHGLGVGNVAMVQAPAGPGGLTRACVRSGIYLVSEGPTRLALMLRQEERGQDGTTVVEALCADQETARTALAEISDLALRHNVFRGQVVSFDEDPFGPLPAVLGFRDRPRLDRSRLILPEGVLESVEDHVLGVSRHARRLLASGQHLKRGLLLHGPPGTGKTHTIRYLLGHAPEVTAVILSGQAVSMIGAACAIARALAPAIVVVEDVDLIAQDREVSALTNPFLFRLLNEMDGLGEDVDVAFVLTTNRADLLEPALAARPGRVDQAVAFELPDAAARRRLLELYRGGLDLEGVDAETVVERTAG